MYIYIYIKVYIRLYKYTCQTCGLRKWWCCIFKGVYLSPHKYIAYIYQAHICNIAIWSPHFWKVSFANNYIYSLYLYKNRFVYGDICWYIFFPVYSFLFFPKWIGNTKQIMILHGCLFSVYGRTMTACCFPKRPKTGYIYRWGQAKNKSICTYTTYKKDSNINWS